MQHFADTPSPSLLKSLLPGEGRGCSGLTGSLTAPGTVDPADYQAKLLAIFGEGTVHTLCVFIVVT